MELLEAIRQRRTVYRFQDRPISRDLIDRCIDAARFAPNHKLTEPWRFIVVGPKTKLQLGEVAKEVAIEKAGGAAGDELEAIVQKQMKKITGLPGLIAITSRLSPEDAFREQEDYAATVCALHNLVLALWGEDIGAQWGTGRITRHERALAILGIDTSKETCIGFLKFGYPDVIPQTKRKEVHEITTYLE